MLIESAWSRVLPSHTKENQRQALATVSTLKRAMGIPNHSEKHDIFDLETCHIYTSDPQSAELLGELLWRYGNGNRKAFYDAHPEKSTVRDTISVTPLDEGGYDISIWAPYPLSFSKALQKMVNKHIAPDAKWK